MALGLLLLTLFSALMLGIGMASVRRSRSYDDFVVAGRSQGTFPVTFSILATCVGASATVGLMDQAAAGGFPYFWFLGAAGVGLAVQALTVAGPIRDSDVRTFGELVRRQFGPGVQRAVSILIALGWIAIVAAQFKAAGSLVDSLLGNRLGAGVGVVLAALLIVGYTLPGGQQAVIRTDVVQFAMVGVGLLGVLLFLVVQAPGAWGAVEWRPVNATFTLFDLVHHLLIVGGIYVISPNLVSRVLTARDARVARRAVWLSAPLLAATGAVVAFIGVYATASGAVPSGAPVFSTLSAQAGLPGSLLLHLSILAAVISSADTTLLVTASIVQQDLVGRPSVAGVRVWGAALAAAAVALVLGAPGATLYTLLFTAYNAFAPAVAPLVFAGFYARGRMNPRWVWTGFGLGMTAGAVSAAWPLARAAGEAGAGPLARWAASLPSWERQIGVVGFVAVSVIAAVAAARTRRRTG